MPAGMGEEERFAAAVEHGTTPASTGGVGDSAGSVARELEIVALLRAGGPGLAPDAAAKARAKRRLMAAFAQEFGHDGELTRRHPGADDATGPLQVLAPVALAERPTDRDASDRDGDRDVLAEPTPLRRPRAGRHSAPEPDVEDEPVAEPDEEARGTVRRLRRRTETGQRGHSRAALVGAAAAAALVALAGTGTFASRNALPGDSMYGMKRVAESTGYALTFGEQAKARRHLEQAKARLDEVEGLVARNRAAASGASGGAGASGKASASAASDQDLVRTTMQEFDRDTTEGSRQLLSGPKVDTGQVDEVRTWATQQSQRLTEIRPDLPAQDRVDQSLALLNQVLGETEVLQGCTAGAACGPTASAGASGRTATTPAPNANAGGGAAAKAHHDSATTGDTGADVQGSTDAEPSDGRTSARGSAQHSSAGDADSAENSDSSGNSGNSDDRRRRNNGDGGTDGSDSSGDGPGTLSVPVVGSVNLPPPVSGLVSGLHLGG